MTWRTWSATVFCVVGAFTCGCESETEDELQDLKEARANTDEVVKELEAEVKKKRKELLELEKKLALAKAGVTDEVRREQKELLAALEEQRKDVEEEISEIQKEADKHNSEAAKVAKLLEKTTVVERVEGEVKAETKVIPGDRQVAEKQTSESVKLQELFVDKTQKPTPKKSDAKGQGAKDSDANADSSGKADGPKGNQSSDAKKEGAGKQDDDKPEKDSGA